MIDYITLGKTGLKVSKLGLGGIPLQRIDEKQTKILFDAMIEAGVNYIDTARGYTISETLIGKAIEGRRDKFILATKSMARTKEAMAKDIEISLTNLKTDYIDLYQIHNPNLNDLETVLAPSGALEALMEAKNNHKIGHIGITTHYRDVFEKAISLDFVETIMFPYNLIENQGEDLIALCHQKNIGFIDMKPLAGGAIEDASLALAYIVQNPHVDIVIPGMGSVEELTNNLAACTSKVQLDEAKIESIRQTLGTQFCRRCNYCAPCSVGIQIPSVFLFEGYLDRYQLKDWAKERYDSLAVKADACIACHACEARCPYQLPIAEMMKRASKKFQSS